MIKHTLIPDWEEPLLLALVWPYDLPAKRDHLIDFYKSFVGLLLEHIPELHLLIFALPGAEKYIQETFSSATITLPGRLEMQDIWIRDYAPYWKRDEEEPRAIKTYYYPTYADKKYLKNSSYDNSIGEMMGWGFEYAKCDGFRLILDGGNLTHNGAGKGIMTNRYIADNEWISMDILIHKTNEIFGFDELLFIPVEYGDDTGHVDGMVRFLTDNKVIVSEYRYDWSSGQGYISESDYKIGRDQMNRIAESLVEKGFSVFRMSNGIPMNSPAFGSAVGNYTNFLRIGERFFLPQYGDEDQDKWAVTALLLAGIEKHNIIPVPDCNDLAKLGGVLNCITAHVYYG